MVQLDGNTFYRPVQGNQMGLYYEFYAIGGLHPAFKGVQNGLPGTFIAYLQPGRKRADFLLFYVFFD
jgi:hypothetical protein